MAELAPDDPRHGTANGYGNLGCRCDECRNANTDYYRERKGGGYSVFVCPGCGGEMRTVSQLCRSCYDAAREPEHGTETRYQTRGCRCDECRAAATAARRQRRHANPERDAAYQRAYKARRRAKVAA